MPFLIAPAIVGPMLPAAPTFLGLSAGAWAAIGAGTAIGGTVMGMRAASQQAKVGAALAERNAQIAAQEAEQKRQAGRIEARRMMERRERMLGMHRALTAGRGFTMEGSPLLKQIDIAEAATLDILMTQYNTQIGVSRSVSESQLYRAQAKSAKRAGRLNVGTALFSGASQVANIGMQYRMSA